MIQEGEIDLDGERVSGRGVDVNALRRDVGIVFQSFNLFPHMTVRENITLGPRKVLMLLDEITSALDPELVSEVLDIVRQLAREGMTMMLATHEMSFAREVSNRVCFLEGGKVVEVGPPDQIFGAPENARTAEFLRRVIEAGRM